MLENKISNVSSILIKALIIGGCLTFFMASTVFATSLKMEPAEVIQSEEGSGVGSYAGPPDDVQQYESKELKEMHQQIDEYVFHENNGSFADLGFKVVITGPREGKIEIGIIPYKDEFAQHFYEKFGSELVSVVEGAEAFTLETQSMDMDQPVSNKDVVITQDEGKVETDTQLSSSESSTPAENKPTMAITLIIAALLLSAIFYAVKRKRA